MAPPDDFNTSDDLTLVSSARAGDRLAFGVLYLRHHAAAWRVACVASRFSPDAELAVIEGFTRVFSALPEETEEFAEGGVSFRPYVLACVRQAALDRAQSAGRAEALATPDEGTRQAGLLAGLGPDGEVVLSTLEHHIARGALAALPERSRTALWLSDVEAMTPGEVAGILGGGPQELIGVAAGARAEIHADQQAALGREEVRADCRFTVDHLDAYQGGTLDPADGLIVRSHLEHCPPCRMRQGELANVPAALAAAVPAAPLLGGEAQHHWLTSLDDLRPAERLLPPGLAAGGIAPRTPLGRNTVMRLGTVAGVAAAPVRRLPDALRRAGRAAADSWHPQPDSIDLTTSPGAADPAIPTGAPGWTGAPGASGSLTPALPPAWTIPPRWAATGRRSASAVRAGSRRLVGGRLAMSVRRAGRPVWPALPAMALALVWVVLMLAVVPRLMTPETAPGPGALALPAVQAYVPGFSPGAGHAPSPRPSGAEQAAQATSASVAMAEAPPSVSLIALAPSTPSGPGSPARHQSPRSPTPRPATTPAGDVVVAAAVVPVITVATTTPIPTLAPLPAATSTSPKPAATVKPKSAGKAIPADHPGRAKAGGSGKTKQQVPRGGIVTA